MNRKRKLASALLCQVAIIFYLCTNSTLVYADGGATGGYQGGSGASTDPLYDCAPKAKSYSAKYGMGRCNRWIKVTIDQFKTAFNNKYGDYYEGGKKITSAENSVCSDISKNTSGQVIIAGHTNPRDKTGIALWNMYPLPTVWSGTNYKLSYHDTPSGWGDHQYDATTGQDKVNIMDDLVPSDPKNRTYEKLMEDILNDLGVNEAKLAYFCLGMDTSIVQDKTGTANVAIKATIEGQIFQGQSGNIKKIDVSKLGPDGKVEINVSLDSSITLNGSAKEIDVTKEKWNNFTKGSSKITLSMSEKSKEICGYSKINPSTLVYDGTTGTYKSGSGTSESKVCVTIMLDGSIPIEKPTSNTASIEYEEGDCSVSSVNGTHSSGAAGVYSLDYNQSEAGVNYSLGSPSQTSISSPTSLEAEIKSDSIGRLSGVFGRIANPYNVNVTENGGTNQETHTMPGPETATFYYTYDKVDIYKEDIQTEVQTYVKTEYRNLQYSSTTESSAKKTCQSPTIYREGLAGIQVKNKRKVTNEYGNAKIPTNYLLATNFTDLGMPNVNTQAEENNEDAIVYMGSENTDSIKIKTTHTIKRRANDGINFKYDITNSALKGYTINAPWNTAGDIITKSGAQQLGYNQEINLPSDERTIESQDINLGEYDKVINDTFSSNDKLTIGYNNSISETGLPISASTGVHLYRPWNYNLSFTSIQTNGTSDGQVFLNGGSRPVEIVAEVNNDNNSNTDSNQVGNASYSPDTTINLYSFTISDTVALTVTDINTFIHSKVGTGIPVTGQTQMKQFDPESTNTKITFSDVPVSGSTGDHVCYYVTINYTNSKDDTAGNTHTYYGAPNQHTTYSEPTCFTITSIPTTQIRGGSLYAEGDVKAKAQSAGTGLFGSWVDYGLISNGTVSQLASGKAIKQTGGTYDEGNNSNHPLTVANYNGSILTSKGKANMSSPATKNRIVSLYSNPSGTVTPKTGDINISDSDNYIKYTSNQYTAQSTDPNAKYRYTKVGNGSKITQSLALDAGITHVIYSEGSITIGSDLEYTNGDYTSISEIPQYIIIAKGGINIENNVERVDAWLITNETINTCTENGSVPSDLHQSSDVYRSGICGNALTVNGPVFAKNILLERTSVSSTSKAAEVFNITAANYYWAFAKAKENGKTSTVYTRSLAPRY